MLRPVLILSKGRASVVGRIDIDTFNLSTESLPQCFEHKQVISDDQPVIEDVVVGDPVRSMVGLLRVLQENARLQLRPVLLFNPSEFEFRANVAPL